MSDPKRRMIQGLLLADETADTWVDLFDEDARMLFKIEAKDTSFDSDSIRKKFGALSGTLVTPRLGVKYDTYQDATRVRTSVSSLKYPDPIEAGKKMLAVLQKLKAAV